MKKILFVINHMDMGGIQRALVELLKQIGSMYDISLMVIKPDGVLMNELPATVKVIRASDMLLASEQSLSACKNSTVKVIKALFSAWSRLFSRRIPAYITARFFQRNIGDYDAAISFTQPVASRLYFNLSNEVVLYSCTARKKITFVHCDFLSYGGNDACNRSMYLRFDQIAAVSDSVGEKVVKAIPEVRNKLVTVYNCHDEAMIKCLAEDNSMTYNEKYSVVTVARLSTEKGIERCLEIFAKLRRDGVDIRWHIVGDGPSRAIIEEKIAECGAEDAIVLHGMQVNPYRYMKNADLLFLPSYHEAAPMVFGEAEILQIPVLTTNTTSAMELVQNRECGWVCEQGADSIEDVLRQVIAAFEHGNKPMFPKQSINEIALKSFSQMI